ncbi:yrdC domain-containing protein, mitochondrial isoform X2 [Scyliorhinus canicula]|uniref:yrdC domain-containing protein, mitochondrial isoform X2 n=1 Tax=Scyliorhinus canicula TaxID=7830 RepID=UPI0018F550A0|nr:yrdC domain-containing protein, mitochondrial isoform X2 [Scyliorhinus canicula]
MLCRAKCSSRYFLKDVRQPASTTLPGKRKEGRLRHRSRPFGPAIPCLPSFLNWLEYKCDWNEVLAETVKVLQCGRVVAVPTDTIYGITCLAQNSEAIRRIYEIKGRNEKKPLAICVGNVEDIYKYCKVTVSDQVLRDLLPGPVTLVFKRSDELNKDLNPFTELVGVRIPKHPFIQKLAQMCGEPLALTSANLSSQTSPLTTEEFRDLWPLLGLVVDGGPVGNMMNPECRLGSTVVGLGTPGKYSIIRPGCAFAATVKILQDKHGLSLQSQN